MANATSSTNRTAPAQPTAPARQQGAAQMIEHYPELAGRIRAYWTKLAELDAERDKQQPYSEAAD